MAKVAARSVGLWLYKRRGFDLELDFLLIGTFSFTLNEIKDFGLFLHSQFFRIMMII